MEPIFAPGATLSMLAAKLFPLERIVSRSGSIAHYRDFLQREHLQLPHAVNCPPPRPKAPKPIAIFSHSAKERIAPEVLKLTDASPTGASQQNTGRFADERRRLTS